jgi:cysteine synthase A
MLQGWTPDFISDLVDQAVSRRHIDQLVPVSGDEAIKCSIDLARKEGILTGISGGGSFAGALKVAQQAKPGSTILCMLADTGERYLSTPLFADVEAEMNAEEQKISKSTPNCQF